MNRRGYSTRTSVLSYNYPFNRDYNVTLPPSNYPSASPYTGLTKLYHSLIKRKIINKKLMKKLLYPECDGKVIDLNDVKLRQHVSECIIMTRDMSCDGSGRVINCDSVSNSDSSSNSNSSDCSNKKIYRQNAVDSSSDYDDDDSSTSSSNPFGYVRYYNPQTGSKKETEYESYSSVIDHDEDEDRKDKTCVDERNVIDVRSKPILAQLEETKKSSIIVTTTAKLQLVNQASFNSENSSVLLAPKPYMACEDLPSLDADVEIDNLSSTQTYVPTTRQSLPPKFVGNKFNESILTNIPLPNWQSSSDNCINRKRSAIISPTLSSTTSSTSTTAHSSSLDLPINPIPLPDHMVAELLYNYDDGQSESFDSELSGKTVIKPPRMFHDSDTSLTDSWNLSLENIGFKKHSINSDKPKSRRLSVQLDDTTKGRCLSYQYVELHTPSPSTTGTSSMHCRCCVDSSPRSSDSGMAGSYTLNSPDIPTLHNLIPQEGCSSNDMSNLYQKYYDVPELDAQTLESQCPCTSPFGSTPSTSSCVSSTRASISSANRFNLKSTKNLQLKRTNDTNWIPTQKSKSLSSITDGNNKNFTTTKIISNVDNVNESNDNNKIYKSGLYAHWWLKAKIPIDVIKGMYEESSRNTRDAGKG